MSDDETLAVYAARADDYAALTVAAPGAALKRFAAALPPNARVLDLGCGPGACAGYLASHGHDVLAWDATPEMVALAARQSGVRAERKVFDDLPSVRELDGVWANFSLLHAPRGAMPRHLADIAAALKPDGVFHLGTKLGEGERRDALGRFYTFYSEDELTDLLRAAGLEPTWMRKGREKGLAGTIDPFILLQGMRTGKRNASDRSAL